MSEVKGGVMEGFTFMHWFIIGAGLFGVLCAVIYGGGVMAIAAFWVGYAICMVVADAVYGPKIKRLEEIADRFERGHDG